MATKAKLEGNARYLAKFKTISIRIPVENFEFIEQAAKASQMSVSGFIAKAAQEAAQQMTRKNCD